VSVDSAAHGEPQAVPTALSNAAGKLERLFADLRADDGIRRSAWEFPGSPPNRYRVLTISGTRGAGKTTLLDVFARSLSERRDTIVLAPLQPEMFSPVDTVFSVVLARLRALIGRDCEPGTLAETVVPVPDLEATYNLAQALDSLLRSSSFRHDRSTLLEQNAPSLNQYSSDFVAQALAGEEFTNLWDATLRTCAETLGGGPDTPSTILIPIDDPDLAPEFLSSILRDIRIVAKTPHAMVCVCLDLTETRNVLSAEYVRSLGMDLRPEGAYAIVEAQLSKALPAPLRVNLPTLSQAQRLSFVPLGYPRPPLEDLLSQLEVPVAGGSFCVGDLFWLPDASGRRGKPSPYADCLPAVPRDLEQLHHALYAYVSDSTGEETAGLAGVVQLLVESAVRNGYRRTPDPRVDVERLVSVEQPATEGELPRLLLDFTGLNYVRESPSDSLRMRPDPERVDFSVETGTLGLIKAVVGEEDEGQGQRILHPSLALGLLLGREFGWYGQLFQEDITGGEAVIGGRANYIMNLRDGTFAGDRFFLVLPRWRTFYDYFAFEAAWRSALGHARDLTIGFDFDPPGVLPGLIITYIRSIAEIQSDRRAEVTREEFAEFCEPAPEEALAAAWERAAGAIAYALESEDDIRHRAFQNWVLVYLAMACHPWLLPDWMIERILAERASWVDAIGGSNSELRQALHQRIRANLGESWVTPIFEAFRDMPDLELDVLEIRHQQSVSQREHELLGTSPPAASIRMPSSELARIATEILQEMMREEQQRESAD
jgi:hypothetical protein